MTPGNLACGFNIMGNFALINKVCSNCPKRQFLSTFLPDFLQRVTLGNPAYFDTQIWCYYVGGNWMLNPKRSRVDPIK